MYRVSSTDEGGGKARWRRWQYTRRADGVRFRGRLQSSRGCRRSQDRFGAVVCARVDAPASLLARVSCDFRAPDLSGKSGAHETVLRDRDARARDAARASPADADRPLRGLDRDGLVARTVFLGGAAAREGPATTLWAESLRSRRNSGAAPPAPMASEHRGRAAADRTTTEVIRSADDSPGDVALCAEVGLHALIFLAGDLAPCVAAVEDLPCAWLRRAIGSL